MVEQLPLNRFSYLLNQAENIFVGFELLQNMLIEQLADSVHLIDVFCECSGPVAVAFEVRRVFFNLRGDLLAPDLRDVENAQQLVHLLFLGLLDHVPKPLLQLEVLPLLELLVVVVHRHGVVGPKIINFLDDYGHGKRRV